MRKWMWKWERKWKQVLVSTLMIGGLTSAAQANRAGTPGKPDPQTEEDQKAAQEGAEPAGVTPPKAVPAGSTPKKAAPSENNAQKGVPKKAAPAGTSSKKATPAKAAGQPGAQAPAVPEKGSKSTVPAPNTASGAAKSASQGTQKVAPAPAPTPDSAGEASALPRGLPVTLVPLLGLGKAEPLAPDFTGQLFTELKRYEGFELRIRKPPQPLTAQCVTHAPCLAGMGRALETPRLLVGVLGPRGQGLGLTLVLFDVATQKVMKLASLSLPMAALAPSDLLQPGVAPLALEAGGSLSHTPIPTLSLEQRIDATQSDGQSARRSVELVPEPSASVPDGSTVKVAKHQQEQRARDEQKQAERESREREKARRAELVRQETERRLEEKRLAQQRIEEEKAARERARLEDRWEREVQKVRAENQKRQARGQDPLPDLPRPEQESSAQRSEAHKTQASKSNKQPQQPVVSSGTASSRPSASANASGSQPSAQRVTPGERSKPSRSPREVSEQEIATLKTSEGSNSSSDAFLEREAEWQVGGGVAGTGLMGYGLAGPTLEVGMRLNPQLWLNLAAETLHGTSNTGERYYLVQTRLGANFRFGESRIHPEVGGELLLLSFGPQAAAVGAWARGGLELMVHDAVGVELSLGVGALYSGAWQGEPYGYPSALNAVFRAGVSTHVHF
ncbi:MAG: hypothetical protein ACKO6N_09405 [Myxococcota bacterium]